MKRYLYSLPERTLRAIAAGLGGFFYEVSRVLLPGWLRGSRLYQATVARLLRITIELVGGVEDVLPPEDLDVRQLAIRKAAGNVVEVASFLAVGWSPIWLLAAAADISGGTRVYLNALVDELKQSGLLQPEAEIRSTEELLNILEATSGQAAETIDVPPLNVADMRSSLTELRSQAGRLPDAGRLAGIFAEMQQVASGPETSLGSVSAMIGAGAFRAGIKLGHLHIFDYYQDALGTIRTEGYSTYARRVALPFLRAARDHFDPQTVTYTDRLLARFTAPQDSRPQIEPADSQR